MFNMAISLKFINEGSGWITESTDSQYINISIFRRLSGIS